MPSAVRLREDYSRKSFARSLADRRTSARVRRSSVAGGGPGWHGPGGGGEDRAGWIARRCTTGFIASTLRGRRASSTTGQKVLKLVCRSNGSLSLRRSWRPARTARKTASSGGGASISSVSLSNGSASTFIRAMSESPEEAWRSLHIRPGRAIRRRMSAWSRLSKNVWPAPSARDFSRAPMISLLQRIRLRRTSPSQDGDTRTPVLINFPASSAVF